MINTFHAQPETRSLPAVRPRSALQWVCVPLLAFFYPVIIAITHKGFLYDDAFILIRYAQHLADGTGWQFNPGMATENAATSPLYVLLVAGAAVVGASPVVASTIIYTAAWGLGGILLARVLYLDGRRVAAWIGCALYSTSPLLLNVRGMETSVYLLLILAAVLCLQRERWILLGGALGLVTIVRADAVLYSAIVFVWLVLRRPRRTAVAVAVPFAVIAASWTAALWAMTGTPFPSTLAAKLAQRDSGIFGSPWAFLRMLHVYGVVGGDGGGSVARSITLGIIGLVLIGLALIGTMAAFRQGNVTLQWLAVAAAIVVVEFGLLLRMPPYHWHYGPFALWVLAGAAVGLEELLHRGHRFWVPIVVPVTLVASVLAAGCHLRGFMEAHSHYREVAEWIDRDSHAARPTVAVGEIGTIGYYSRADIVDYMGLLDARAIEPVRHNDFSWWLSQKPEYFVTATVFALDDPTKSSPQFQREYQPAARFGTVTVYRRIG